MLAGIHPGEHGDGRAGTDKGVVVLSLPNAHGVDGHIEAVVVCGIGGKTGRDKSKVDSIARICREVNGAPVPHAVARLAV